MPLIEGTNAPIGCTRQRAVARDALFSLEESNPSMGKMAGAGRQGGLGGS